MYLFINFFVFLFGLCIGSFLNCVIYRMSLPNFSFWKNLGGLNGRSYCPHCKHQLNWLDLIPVVSFLFLGGRCRYCHKKISIQYPIVEILTGLLFLLIFNLQFTIFNQFSIFQIINLLFLWYIISSLIVIFVYDLKYYLIPDNVLFPAIIMTFFYRSFENWLLEIEKFMPFVNYIFAALVASGFFLCIFLMSKGKWMGFGDVKLAILLGLLLGFPDILVGLFLSFFSGAIIGIELLFFKKKGLKSEMPFAPFLIIGTLISMFWGQEIINWYLNFLI